MRKISFNDEYNLTKHVINGEITIYLEKPELLSYVEPLYRPPTFNVGEIIAIAQPYKDIPSFRDNPRYVGASGYHKKHDVKAWVMPHHIEIVGKIKPVQIKDVTNAECFKAGVLKSDDRYGMYRLSLIHISEPTRH